MVKYTFMMHVGRLRVQNNEAHFKNCTECSPSKSLSFKFLVWNTSGILIWYKYGFVKTWCMFKVNLVYYLYWKKQLLQGWILNFESTCHLGKWTSKCTCQTSFHSPKSLRPILHLPVLAIFNFTIFTMKWTPFVAITAIDKNLLEFRTFCATKVCLS